MSGPSSGARARFGGWGWELKVGKEPRHQLAHTELVGASPARGPEDGGEEAPAKAVRVASCVPAPCPAWPPSPPQASAPAPEAPPLCSCCGSSWAPVALTGSESFGAKRKCVPWNLSLEDTPSRRPPGVPPGPPAGRGGPQTLPAASLRSRRRHRWSRPALLLIRCWGPALPLLFRVI